MADPATIDCALRELAGFRMGPLELTDLIGQDVNLAVGTSVWEQTGRDERYAPTDFQRRLVSEGRLGPQDRARRLRVRRQRSPPGGRSRRGAGPPARRPGRSRPTRSPGRWPCSSTRRSTSSRAGRRAPRTSTPRCAWAPTTRGGRSSGATEIGLDVVAAAAGRARRGLPRRALPAQPGAAPSRSRRSRPADHRSPRMSAAVDPTTAPAAAPTTGTAPTSPTSGGCGPTTGPRPGSAWSCCDARHRPRRACG